MIFTQIETEGQLKDLRANTEAISVCHVNAGAVTLRVVLVDDDADFRALACRALASEGVDVVADLGSGAEVLSVVRRWQPDVVLVDIHMPNVDGVEVARRLREDGGDSVVVLISTREQAHGNQLAEGLAKGYLRKDQLSLAAILQLITPTA